MFQSLSRDSVCSNLVGNGSEVIKDLFQSLSRDSVCSNVKPRSACPICEPFQSLSRDSVCSNHGQRDWSNIGAESFQSLSRDSVCSNLIRDWNQWLIVDVSIPQSGFCVLKPRPLPTRPQTRRSFNPSVGILCAQTASAEARRAAARAVSIPQSGFCVLKPPKHWYRPSPADRFNPSVGILCAQTPSWTIFASLCHRFNPSVGILCAQTPSQYCHALIRISFQSLSRDSVCSNVAVLFYHLRH